MATRGRSRSKSSGPVALTAEMRVVLLHGKEMYLRAEYTRLLMRTLEETHGEIERFDYDGESTDIATILDELRSYGLMQQHKLVVVDNTDKLLAGATDDSSSKRASARSLLEKYVQSPVDHATLLLRSDIWRKSKLDGYIGAVGTMVKCESPDAAEVIRWCVARVEKRYESSISPNVARCIVERVGSDLNRLDMELVKLSTAAGSGGAIDEALVAEMVGRTREEEAWAIQQSLGSGDPARALGHLVELFEVSRVAAEPVSWSITDLLRKIAACRRMLDDGVPAASVGKTLRLWPKPQADMVVRVARGLSPQRCAQLLQHAIDTDRRNKRGVGDSMRSLEALTMLVTDEMKSATLSAGR